MRGVTEGQRQAEKNAPGSDRNFGLTMAAVAVIAGSLPLLRGAAPHWTFLIVAAVFAVLSLLAPRVLYPLNYIWFRFGLLLHHIVSPLRRRADLQSYWIVRDPPGPEPGTMTNQF